jgi:hypothetical protein
LKNFLSRLLSVTVSTALIFSLTITTPHKTKATTTYTFTSQYSNTCTGTAQAPLDPTNWNSIGIPGSSFGQLPEFDELEVFNKTCTTTTQVQDDGQGVLKSGIITSANQYAQYTLKNPLTPNDTAIWVYLRAGVYEAPAYALVISGQTGITNGAQFEVIQYDSSGSGITYDWGAVNFTAETGTKYTFAVYGTDPSTAKWYFFKGSYTLVDSSLLSTAGSSNILSSGTVGMQLDAISGNNAHVGISNFHAGEFTVTE